MLKPEESSLLDAVTDRKLRLCLDNLRPAVEGLWRAGTPRIVQDFTDHGIEHYERISEYASHLLAARAPETKPLSAVEMFLLVGGIYLHDVGMQCDVTTEEGKEIKKRAEALGKEMEKRDKKLGGNLGETRFTATSANRYSLDEQKAIRKHHHYLSAAWIEYAHETGNTVLGSAAQQIPFELVQDLMDVCLHHTSIPIEYCPNNLAGGGAGRKRLVAALLRFADELDISSNRVDMAAVTQFAVNAGNAVFWWLHNLTNVTFSPPNTFRLSVRLRDTEFDEFAPLVRSFYLDKFQAKNREILSVLQSYGFPAVLDAYGDVIPLRATPALPDPIKNILRRDVGSSPSDLEKEAVMLTSSAVEVRLSIAVSVDGFIDDSKSRKLVLSNSADWDQVDIMRMWSDAILVGGVTVRKDNPRLVMRNDHRSREREAEGRPSNPIKVTITESGNLDPTSEFFQRGSARKLVYCPDHVADRIRAQIGQAAEIRTLGTDHITAKLLLADLASIGVRRLMVEGGSSIATMFLEEGLVNEMRLAIAPFFIGEVGEEMAPRFVHTGAFPHVKNNEMKLKDIEKIGDMAVLHYTLKRKD